MTYPVSTYRLMAKGSKISTLSMFLQSCLARFTFTFYSHNFKVQFLGKRLIHISVFGPLCCEVGLVTQLWERNWHTTSSSWLWIAFVRWWYRWCEFYLMLMNNDCQGDWKWLYCVAISNWHCSVDLAFVKVASFTEAYIMTTLWESSFMDTAYWEVWVQIKTLNSDCCSCIIKTKKERKNGASLVMAVCLRL